MESLTTLIAKDTSLKDVPYSILRLKSIGYISLCGYEGLSRDVFPSLIWSWMSPTRNSLPRVSPFEGNSLSLVSLDVTSNSMGYQSKMLKNLSKFRSVWIQCRSEIQLTQELRNFLDDLYDVSFTKFETTSHASQISNISLRSLLIGMGSCHTAINTLGKSISQGLTTNDCRGFCLPGGNYPSWLAYTSEGPSVLFQVPGDIDRHMKGIILRNVYSSTSENRAAECLTNVLIINYTKCTIQIYKGDTIMSFNDEDWKGLISNLGPGDIVEIFVVFGHGLIVKETTVYLIYDQSNTAEFEQPIIMEVGPSINLEMEPSVSMQPSPEVNMQPSPNTKAEASTDVKTDLSREMKVQSSPIMKMKPSQKLSKSVFTRLAKRMGTCLCLKPAYR